MFTRGGIRRSVKEANVVIVTDKNDGVENASTSGRKEREGEREEE